MASFDHLSYISGWIFSLPVISILLYSFLSQRRILLTPIERVPLRTREESGSEYIHRYYMLIPVYVKIN